MSVRPKPHPLGRVLRLPFFKDSTALGLASLLLPGGSLLAYSHFLETRWLERTQHTLELPGMKRPLKVLHLSDLHLTRADTWHEGLLDACAALQCDVLVLTGDLVMPGFALEEVISLLKRLPNPPLGRFLCPGNWEYWSGLSGEALENLCAAADIHLLLDTWIPLDCGLVLAGTDSELGGTPQVETLLSALPTDRPALVLTHCPSTFVRLDQAPVRLVLAGHTHGGQIRLPGLGALWLPAGSSGYDQGLFQGQHASLFVSRGLGTSMARLRFLCRPEATLLTLKPPHTDHA